jgi:hypothetical protein
MFGMMKDLYLDRPVGIRIEDRIYVRAIIYHRDEDKAYAEQEAARMGVPAIRED